MDEVLVSAIIPSYNRYSYLENAISSIENQTYKNIEIIVINDGSDQNEYYSKELANRVNLINLKENQTQKNGFGPGSIRNFGINEASGKFIAFLDDDDHWLENKLEIQVNELINKKMKFSSTEGYFGNGLFDKNNDYKLYNKEKFFKKIKKKYKGTKYFRNGFPEIWNYDFINVHNCIILSSVMVERELINLVGGFRNIPGAEDYDCWKAILLHEDLLYVDKPLFYYDGSHGDGQQYIIN